MRALVPLALTATLASCGAAATSAPTATDAPSITVGAVNGSGCPVPSGSGTVNGNDVTFAYGQFTAKAADQNIARSRVNCQAGISLHPVAGTRYAITSVDHSGSASIPAGASGLVQTTFYPTGKPTLGVASTPVGPVEGAWQANQPVPTTVVGPCSTNQTLQMNIELRVSSPNGLAVSLTEAQSVVHVAWQAC